MATLLWPRLRARWELSTFEDHSLWLAAAARLDPAFRDLIATYWGSPQQAQVSPALCQRLFASQRPRQLSAITTFERSGRLGALGLVRLGPPAAGGHAPHPLFGELVPAPFVPHLLRGERVVAGVGSPWLRRIVPEVSFDQIALPAQQREELSELVPGLRPGRWLGEVGRPEVYDEPLSCAVLISGPGGSGKSLAARALATRAGQPLMCVRADALRTSGDTDAARALDELFIEAECCQEWLLLDGCDHLLKDEAGMPTGAHALVSALVHLLETRAVTVILTAELPERIPTPVRGRLTGQATLTALDRRLGNLCWQLNLPGETTLGHDVDLDALGRDMPLSGRNIHAALRSGCTLAAGAELDAETLTTTTRWQQPAAIGAVAKRSLIRRCRDDLLLPAPLAASVDELIATERIREKILRGWGLEGRIRRGLGLVCLFDGEPGTGKTLAAEVIASELDLPLFTVSVPNVVSKWIGETEQNLQRVFEQAQRSRCVVLFDEADSLFSKRTEVSRSVDRYSNMEISVLLQLVENYRGLVLLTTNLRGAIDPAFDRRFAYKLKFTLPDAEIRAAIWRRLLPPEQLAPDVDFDRLGENYELAGGSIRTIVLRSTYRAAIEGNDRITDEIVTRCARKECRALGRLVREEAAAPTDHMMSGRRRG